MKNKKIYKINFLFITFFIQKTIFCSNLEIKSILFKNNPVSKFFDISSNQEFVDLLKKCNYSEKNLFLPLKKEYYALPDYSQKYLMLPNNKKEKLFLPKEQKYLLLPNYLEEKNLFRIIDNEKKIIKFIKKIKLKNKELIEESDIFNKKKIISLASISFLDALTFISHDTKFSEKNISTFYPFWNFISPEDITLYFQNINPIICAFIAALSISYDTKSSIKIIFNKLKNSLLKINIKNNDEKYEKIKYPILEVIIIFLSCYSIFSKKETFNNTEEERKIIESIIEKFFEYVASHYEGSTINSLDFIINTIIKFSEFELILIQIKRKLLLKNNLKYNYFLNNHYRYYLLQKNPIIKISQLLINQTKSPHFNYMNRLTKKYLDNSYLDYTYLDHPNDNNLYKNTNLFYK